MAWEIPGVIHLSNHWGAVTVAIAIKNLSVILVSSQHLSISSNEQSITSTYISSRRPAV